MIEWQKRLDKKNEEKYNVSDQATKGRRAPLIFLLVSLWSVLLGGQPGWTPATLPSERLTPQTYNEIVDKLNHELKRRELTAGVELVTSGEGLSLNKYKQVLGGIERLKDDSEEVKAVYDDTAVVLPKSDKIEKGHPVSANEFAKIRNMLTTAEQERLHGEVEDHGNFVLVKPPTNVKGVTPPSDRVYGNENYWKGVFISGRTVRLSNYYIGKYEVTYKLWKEVYDWNANNNKGYSFRSGRKGSHGDSRNTENDPVTEVSWYDCIVWCNAYTHMTKGIEQCVYVYSDTNQVIKSTNALTPSKVKYDQSKKGYRLPTEAEWEYAARFQGRDSTNALKYNKDYLTHLDSMSGAKKNYQNHEENDRVAWYRDNSDKKTHRVGEKAANYAKIHDMSGNVWEWIYDGWDNTIPTGEQTNPITAASAVDRVLRGGSWGSDARSCVVGYRDDWWFDYRGDRVGFRVACSQ